MTPPLHQMTQAPQAVVMVRQHQFTSNPQTAADNAFQDISHGLTPAQISAQAYAEITQAADQLTQAGVTVHLIEDDGSRDTPDSVFPNNWFSTHPGGMVAVYPMYAENRRRERRQDVLDLLKSTYRVREIVDYSPAEFDHKYLEGTGVFVFDHVERTAYVAKSLRAHPELVERLCTRFGYEPILFDTADHNGDPVYHTNVIMCIGTHFALVGTDYLSDPTMRQTVLDRLSASGRTIIELTTHQIGEFAGNALELHGTDGLVVAMSARAHAALTPKQRQQIESHAQILPLTVPTIELAGGSVRCMLAGVHLSPR